MFLLSKLLPSFYYEHILDSEMAGTKWVCLWVCKGGLIRQSAQWGAPHATPGWQTRIDWAGKPLPFPTRHRFRGCGKGKCVLWAAHQSHDRTSPVSLNALRRDPTQAWILLRVPTVLSFMRVNNSLKNLLLQRRICLGIHLEPINPRPYKKRSTNVLTLGPEPLYSCVHSDWQQSTTQLKTSFLNGP